MVQSILTNYQRTKQDNNDDTFFYSQPRYVHHTDELFRRRLTLFYKSIIPKNAIILDLMSSWVSHLPKIKYNKVIGHGLNLSELQKNKQLDSYWVQNLNINQSIPLEDESIDFCLIVAGWQYLQYPEKVASEIYRIIKTKGKVIISFSNRAFWNKTPNIWLNSNTEQRIDYIKSILIKNKFCIESVTNDSKPNSNSLFNYLIPSVDPFNCVVSIKN